jgi:photosystem II stability/assembly factor-like uncharacterized protein
MHDDPLPGANPRRASDVSSRDSGIASSRVALLLRAGLTLILATVAVPGFVHASTTASPADPLPGVETDRTTPADAVPIPRPPAPAESAADSIVASMVARVDEDSIYAFLEKLTGEAPVTFDWGSVTIVSRYTTGIGAEHAAEFLGRAFDSYGYDIEMQYLNFPFSLEPILVLPTGEMLWGGGRGRILRSTDGTSWERTREGIENYTDTVRDLDRVTGTRVVAVGNLGFIATSDDGGLEWMVRTSSATDHLRGVSVRSSGTGWTVGKNGVILRTTDGGVTWTDQVSGTTSTLLDVDALSDTEAVVTGVSGLVLRTTDGGSSWGPVVSGLVEKLRGVVFVGDSGWAVGDAGSLIHSTDRGATWIAQTGGTAFDLNGVSFVDATTGWVVGDFSTILYTTDAGSTWTPQSSPIPNVILKRVHAASENVVWISGLSAVLFRTTDGGANWEQREVTIPDGWANVVATLPGRDRPEEEVLLVGHYDSISDWPHPGELAPGADDNGSGIAAILESARHLSRARYERTVKLVCFTGEEIGLLGSEAYAARALAQGTPIVGVFNLDSVGWNDSFFRIFSNDDSEWLGSIAHTMAAAYAPDLTTYHWHCPTCTWSDHASFWAAGFDAIVGIQSWDPPPAQHHTIGDTLGLLDIPLIANVTRIAVSTVAAVAGVDTAATVVVPPAGDSPSTVRLHRPFPSPSSGTVRVAYDLPHATPVRLTVHDVAGRLVRGLVDGPQGPGRHTVRWDGRNGTGEAVASGVYFYRIEEGAFRQTQRVVLRR